MHVGIWQAFVLAIGFMWFEADGLKMALLHNLIRTWKNRFNGWGMIHTWELNCFKTTFFCYCTTQVQTLWPYTHMHLWYTHKQSPAILRQLRFTCHVLWVYHHVGFLYFALKLKTDIILSGEEGGICPAEDGIDSRLCFYDVLADHYVRIPESGQRILDLIVQLWSQLFVSHIFALLFHKWVCELVWM